MSPSGHAPVLLSQILRVLSNEQDAMSFPFGETATLITHSVCPVEGPEIAFPVLESHLCTVLSRNPDASFPSGKNATLVITRKKESFIDIRVKKTTRMSENPPIRAPYDVGSTGLGSKLIKRSGGLASGTGLHTRNTTTWISILKRPVPQHHCPQALHLQTRKKMETNGFCK